MITYRLPAIRPQVLNPTDELAILAEVLNRPLRLVQHLGRGRQAGMLAVGMPVPVVEAAIARVPEGTDGTELLPPVAQVLGHPPGQLRPMGGRPRCGVHQH